MKIVSFLIHFVAILLKISIELFESFKVSSLNSIDSHRTTTKINFLKKEIEIPDGVSEAIAFEIQKILNDYENRLLKFGRDLISCDGSSSQQEKYLKSYNQFKVQSVYRFHFHIWFNEIYLPLTRKSKLVYAGYRTI